MQHLELVVVGYSDTVALFSLLGAKGFVVDGNEQLREVMEYVEEHTKEIGGILMDGFLYDEESRYIKRLRNAEVPLIFLPVEGDQDAGHKSLEALMERAIGMKIKVD